MKPDGVDTATMEPMEALGSAQDQALPATQTEGEPQPAEALSATNKDKPADPKAKTKAPAKAKPPIAGAKTSTTSSRPTTGQSRLTNGAQKTQTNGVAKKTTTGGLEKKSSTTAPPKKTTPPTTKTPTKVAEKKPVATTRPASSAANGVKTTSQPMKKTPTPANGLKSKPKTTTPAPRPATASTIKTSSASSPKPDRPPVAKTSRSAGSAPATPTTASKTAASRPAPATPKTPSTAAKPSPAKATAPSSGRTPTPSKSATPAKKDVSKPPSAPVAKKPTSSSLTKPPPAKTTKPETPKSASTPKTESKKPTSKVTEVKTSKPKESKATPSKEVGASPRTTGSKTSTKTSSPKKTVGSSTPMSLKGGPKSSQPVDTTATETEKKDVVSAAVASTAVAAAVISVVASEETPEASAMASIPAAPEGFTTNISTASAVKLEDSFTTLIPDSSQDSKEMASSVLAPATTEVPEDNLTFVPPTTEEMLEDLTKFAIPPTCYEAREEAVSPVVLPASEEMHEDFTTSVIPPTSYEARDEPASPVIPPASAETHEDLTKSAIPATSYETPAETVSPVIPPAFDEEPEDTASPVISPTSDEAELVYHHDVPLNMYTCKDDGAMSQLAAEMDHVSLEAQVPVVSPLGTTILSPPSSPIGPTSMPVELPGSTPFVHVEGAAEPWAQSSSMYPSMAPHTTEVQEMEDEREEDEESEPDDEREQEDVQMLSAEEKVVDGFDLLGSAGGDHITSAVPVSPCQEREEAVEKAEEEINEDNDEEEDDDEEEEDDIEEKEVLEFGIKESVHQTEQDDFKKGVAGFASCDWTMTQSDSYNSNKHDAEVTSPVNAEEMGEQADKQQPFTGPPGIQSFGSEDEEEDDEEEHLKEDLEMDLEHDDEHHKREKAPEKENEDVKLVNRGLAESGFGLCENDEDDDDYSEVRHQDHGMGHSAPATSVPSTTAWSHSDLFSGSWAHPSSSDTGFQDPAALTKSDPHTATVFSAEPDTPPKSPTEAFLDMTPPLIQASEPQPNMQEETGSAAPVESGNLAAPAIGMSQSSTLSGTALAAHSSSETSTPEELRDYDSSSGVESRSDKQQTPVPAMPADMEQDLGIHLERGDEEEEEAETLPADEIMGDAATAPASVPSSPSTSGDEASDTEGEMQINVAVDDNTALPALEEDEEAREQIGDGDGDGDTPQSANSVASYGFDCSASISNAHSMAESCGKSPGIFSLENEEQLPEEAKDPSFIKELTLPAATANTDDLGRPVDLLPIGEPSETEAGFDEHYMMCSKTDPGSVEEMDPESPMHLSPQPGDDSDGQPPYYSAICDKTDNFLAGNGHHLSPSRLENRNHPRATQEMNDNNYLAPLPNSNRPLPPRIDVPHVAAPTKLVPNVQLRRLEQHQLQLRHIRQRQEQERIHRLCLEEDRQRQEQQRALERQRRELLQLQLQQQQQEHRLRRKLLQRQLEMEQQVKGQPSPSSGLCTIYEAMETSEEEDEDTENGSVGNRSSPRSNQMDVPLRVANGNLRRPPPQELDWNTKLDMVQQLINQALLLAGEDGCPPLLYLPGQGGGILSPLESSLWPHIMSHLDCSSATVASVSSYSPSSQTSSPQGDWTVVELETHH